MHRGILIMESASILDRTKKIIEEAHLAGENLDTKVLYLLRAEYLRNLGQYRRVDLLMKRKYGITFDEFVSRKIVKEKEYTWEVEKDAMDWETAISGIKTIEQKIIELKKEGCV